MGFEIFNRKVSQEDSNQSRHDEDSLKIYTEEEINTMSDSQREYLKEIQEEEASWDKENNIKNKDNLEFKENEIGFWEGRELKKIKDILNKQIEKDNKENKIKINEAEKQGLKPDKKRTTRQEGNEELERDAGEEGIDIEKTLKRLNEEENKEGKEKVYESLSYSNAHKSIDIGKEWWGKRKGMEALTSTEKKSNEEKIKIYIDAYLKAVPFSKEDSEHTRKVVRNVLRRYAEKVLGSGKIKKEIKKLDETYRKEDEEMLRFRELITKKYFKDDKNKQEDIKDWREDREKELAR